MKWTMLAAFYLFWPPILLVTWGELTPHPPHWTRYFWDKSLHFTAYFGLAAMATLLRGTRGRLAIALAAMALAGSYSGSVAGVVGRDPEVYNEVATCVGVAAGFLVARGFTFVTSARAKLVEATWGGD